MAIRKAGDLAKEVCARLKKPLEEGVIEGVPTGFRDLDEILGGFREGTVNLLAGRPSHGKTSMALGIALHAAVRKKVKVLYIALEHSPDQLVRNMITSMAGVGSHRLRRRRLAPEEKKRVLRAAELLQSAPLHVAVASGMLLDELKVTLDRLCDWADLEALDAPRLVIIDPLEALSLAQEEFEPHEMPDAQEQRERIMQGLAETARSYKTALLALVNLGRGVDRRASHHPLMRDLPYVRYTEPFADTCLLLTRLSYYVSEPADDPNNDSAEITVAKNSFGLTGRIVINFERTFLRFTDAPGDDSTPRWIDAAGSTGEQGLS